MCRALTVLCVAGDVEALADLKRAAAGAEWELLSGATDGEEALRQLVQRPHVLVVFGEFEETVRAAIPGLPRPGGPVRSGLRRRTRVPTRRCAPCGWKR